MELPLAHEQRPAGTLSSAEKDLRGQKGSLQLKNESCGASAGTCTGLLKGGALVLKHGA